MLKGRAENIGGREGRVETRKEGEREGRKRKKERVRVRGIF